MSFEADTSAPSGEVLEDILKWRPPLPVGRADISDIEALANQSEPSEPGYAWERLPRWLTQIDDTFKKANEVPVVHLDVCSSVPLFAQMMRGLEFKRSDERSRDMVHELYDDNSFAFIPEHLKAIHAVVAQGVNLKELLRSAIQRVLFVRNSEDWDSGNEESSRKKYAYRLADAFKEQTDIYIVDHESKDSEGRWQIKYTSQENPRSFY